MEIQKKKNKIYDNEINNNIYNEKISYRRKYQIINSIKNKNNDIHISNNYPNNKNLLYIAKMSITSSVIPLNKNLMHIPNQNKALEKDIYVNNNPKLNSAKKRYIVPIEKNEMIKPKKNNMLIKSVKIEENSRTNFFKIETDLSVGDDKRKNDFNKYETKYQYTNNLNSLHKGKKNKSLEKAKNKKDKIESNKNEQVKNKVNKNAIILKKPQNNHNVLNENIIYKKNIIPQEKDLKKFVNNEIDKIKNENDKFNKEFDLFIELFKEKINEFMKKININNKETINSKKKINSIKNYYNDYLKLGNNFIKKGKYFLNLFSSEEIEKYRIKKEIKNFEIKPNKVSIKKLEICKENNLDILNKKKKKKRNLISNLKK